MVNPEDAHLIARLDERVRGHDRDIERIDTRYLHLMEDLERKEDMAERNRRVDRFTLIGICVTLAGVGVAVAGIVVNAV